MTSEVVGLRIRALIGALLLFPVPVALEWSLLRLLGHDAMLIAAVFPVAVLGAGLALLPVSRVVKLLLAVVLVPTSIVGSGWLLLGYACSAYGECL